MADAAQDLRTDRPAPAREDPAVLVREAFADLMSAAEPQPGRGRRPEPRSFAPSEDSGEGA